MKLIVGLGNPGKIYEHTRHNTGQAVVKELGRKNKVVFKKGLFSSSLSGKCSINGVECLLAVPLTYMNLSGTAVKALIKKHKIGLEDLIVVFDDLDLEQGRVKFKSGGSSGGHKGVESIIQILGTDVFSRIRIGIGRPVNKSMEITNFVLTGFQKNERAVAAEAIEKACSAVEYWVELGAEKTMNIINR